jgi:hypothetical protein
MNQENIKKGTEKRPFRAISIENPIKLKKINLK